MISATWRCASGIPDTASAKTSWPRRRSRSAQPAPSDQASKSAGVSLSLTKALVEANRAQFHIKTGPHSGTLIEVVFAQTNALS